MCRHEFSPVMWVLGDQTQVVKLDTFPPHSSHGPDSNSSNPGTWDTLLFVYIFNFFHPCFIVFSM